MPSVLRFGRHNLDEWEKRLQPFNNRMSVLPEGGAVNCCEGNMLLWNYILQIYIPYWTCTHYDVIYEPWSRKAKNICSSVFLRELCETRTLHCEKVASCDHMFCWAVEATLRYRIAEEREYVFSLRRALAAEGKYSISLRRSTAAAGTRLGVRKWLMSIGFLWKPFISHKMAACMRMIFFKPLASYLLIHKFSLIFRNLFFMRLRLPCSFNNV